MGRPDKTETLKRRKVTPEQAAEIKAAFKAYIEDLDDPLISEFVSTDPVPLKYEITEDNMNDWLDMAKLMRILLSKQRTYLLRKGMNSQNVTMSIFRLKQPYHGFRDRFEQDITSQGEPIKFINTVPRVKPKK
jgi:hypothetical protein